MVSDDPFSLMKELTETFEKSNPRVVDFSGAGFKSLISKQSNPSDLYSSHLTQMKSNIVSKREFHSNLPPSMQASDDLQKMREKRGLGGLSKILGDSEITSVG